jgi:hypothetical protein
MRQKNVEETMGPTTVGEVIGSAVAAVAPLVFRGVRSRVWKFIRHAIGKHERYITEQMVQSELGVYAELNDLLTSLNADRAYVFQFHNGAVFSFRNPVWKLSCTHPAVRAGYSKGYDAMKDVIASTVIELIAPLYGIYGPGTSIHPCHGCLECSKQGRGLAIYDIDQMPETTVKGTLQNRGIKTMVFTPLIYNGDIGGFMGVDYCNSTVGNVSKQCLAELCKASTRVASMLEGKWRL